MACLARQVLMHALCHCNFNLKMAILAGRPAFDVAHPRRTGLMAVNTFELLFYMHILRQTSRFRQFLAEIAVPAPAFHGACMANECASTPACAVHRRRDAAHGMGPHAG